MVVNAAGEFVTARAHPKLVQVKPYIEVEGDVMILSAPGMTNLRVDIAELLTFDIVKAVVWNEAVDAVDAGDVAAQWFSRYVLEEDVGLRLVFYPSSYPTRDVRDKNKVFETAVREDTGALHDASSFMLINESSVEELNTRIEQPVTALRFRPNIVIKGPEAYAEDQWKWIKIGDEVVFRSVKPCTR